MSRLAHQGFAWDGPASADITTEMAGGRRIGVETVNAIREGVSDPDFAMRRLLGLLADRGFIVPPHASVRGFCEAIQAALEDSTP